LATNMNATTSSSSDMDDCASIVDTVCAMEGTTVFCEVLKERMLNPAATSEEDNNKSSSSSLSADTDTMSDPAADDISDLSPSKHNGLGVVRRQLGLCAKDVDDALGLNDASKGQ